jgi:hypothetical protein
MSFHIPSLVLFMMVLFITSCHKHRLWRHVQRLNRPTNAIHSELNFSTDGAAQQRIRFWKSGRFFGFWVFFNAKAQGMKAQRIKSFS